MRHHFVHFAMSATIAAGLQAALAAVCTAGTSQQDAAVGYATDVSGTTRVRRSPQDRRLKRDITYAATVASA